MYYLRAMNTTQLKSLYFIVALLFFGTISAQPTIVSPSDTIYAALDTLSLDGEVLTHWDVVNETGSTLTLMCSRNLVDTVSPFNYPYVYDSEAQEAAEGSYEKFCWGPLCYNFGTDASSTNSSMLVDIAPGETDTTFIAYFYAHDVVGTSTIEYCFHPVDNQDAGSCKSITYVVTAVSAIEDEVSGEVVFSAVYPNPLNGDGFVNYEIKPGDVGTVVFTDLTGQEVRREKDLVLKGKLQVSASEFAQGIGFCTLEINGVAVRTERFVVVR